MTSYRWPSAALLALVFLVLAGCKREEQSPPPATAPPTGLPPGGLPPMPHGPLPELDPHAAGKKVYNANTCFRCHTMGGGFPGPPMGMPGMKGPDLAKAAGTPGRDADWFIAFVSNSRSVKADSKMPPFEKKINADDMKALAEFLMSLK